MELSEIKAIIKKDPETKDLELNDQDLLTAYQYLLLRDGNSLKGFRPILVTKPFLHINYAPTKEKREEELTVQLRQNLETFESDIYIKDASLDDFIVSDEFHEKAMAYVKEFLRDPKKTKGMYLYGPYGSGKSYFFSGLAKELTKRHIDVVYVFLPDLIRSIKQSIGSPELEKKINILKRCDVLILDDLGGENMSMWFRDEILLPILHYRLNANSQVFISSNSSVSQLATLMHLEKDENPMKAFRIIKRIEDMTKSFKFVKTFKID